MTGRIRFCRVCRDWHNPEAWPEACAAHFAPPPKRSTIVPLPMLNRDQIEPLWHPSNGRTYDSKSEFRAATRAAGGEEVGNDVQTDNRKLDTVTARDVGEAIQKLNQGYRPAITETASEGWS